MIALNSKLIPFLTIALTAFSAIAQSDPKKDSDAIPPRVDVFLRSADETPQIDQRYLDGQWSGWVGLGGSTIAGSGPAVCSWGAGRIDIFIRGTTNDLMHKYYDGDWSEWESLGGVLTSDPCAVSWGSGRIDVFARGSKADGSQVMQKTWLGDTGWSEWSPQGGTPAGKPAVCAMTSGELDLFIRAKDDTLQYKSLRDGHWSKWESLGGILTSDPGAASWGEGRIDVFVRSADSPKQLVQKYFRAGQGWSDWTPLAGMPGGTPTICSRGAGRLDIFVRGTDDSLHHKAYDAGKGGWAGWESLGGVLTSDPAAICWTTGR
jgi:hypothetical protein